jgi:hypothetical protein
MNRSHNSEGSVSATSRQPQPEPKAPWKLIAEG